MTIMIFVSKKFAFSTQVVSQQGKCFFQPFKVLCDIGKVVATDWLGGLESCSLPTWEYIMCVYAFKINLPASGSPWPPSGERYPACFDDFSPSPRAALAPCPMPPLYPTPWVFPPGNPPPAPGAARACVGQAVHEVGAAWVDWVHSYCMCTIN